MHSLITSIVWGLSILSYLADLRVTRNFADVGF